MDKIEFQKQPEKGSVTFTIRMSSETSEQLDEIVRQTGLSKNMVINRIIKYGLKNYEIKE